MRHVRQGQMMSWLKTRDNSYGKSGTHHVEERDRAKPLSPRAQTSGGLETDNGNRALDPAVTSGRPKIEISGSEHCWYCTRGAVYSPFLRFRHKNDPFSWAIYQYDRKYVTSFPQLMSFEF